MKQGTSIQGSRAALLFLAVAVALTLGAVGLGCGGNDLAAPEPFVEGGGSASVIWDGEEIGPTELVTALISSGNELPVVVTDELVVWGETVSGQGILANDNLVGVQVTAFEDGMPGNTFQQGMNFTMDLVFGLMTSMGITGTPIADGTRLRVTYTYNEQFPTVNVDVGLPAGQAARITLHNMVSGVNMTPVVSTLSEEEADDAPPPGLAFWLTMRTGENLGVPLKDWIIVDDCDDGSDPGGCPEWNTVTVLSSDLRNQANPCVSGEVRGTIKDDFDTERHTIVISFEDAICP